MQYAKCKSDNKVWEASQFALQDECILEEKRKNLVCTACGEFAWFRKESKHGHPAHFCAHHDDRCELKVNYVSVDDHAKDGTVLEDEVTSGSSIIVRLDQETGGDVEVIPAQQNVRDGYENGGRYFVTKNKERESIQQFTLRRILHRLVKSKDFRNSATDIVFYANDNEIMLNGPVRDIIVNFDEITEIHRGVTKFYWGPVVSTGRTDDGKIWLNSAYGYSSTSVAINEDIADKFLQLFEIDDLDELLGSWVLVAGRCNFSSTGKPIIWCTKQNYIFVRKYKEINLL